MSQNRLLRDYEGCEVRLTEERQEHILSHPEMAEMLSAIEETLQAPAVVRRSRTDAAVRLLYRWYTGTLVGDKWLCVVVKYLPDDAFLLTAYMTDKPKQGEQLWPKS